MAIRYSAPHLVPKALYFAVDDLDEIHQRATTLGCLSDESVHGTPGGKPLVRPWGERSFYCNDPWGNPLCFLQAGTIYHGLGPSRSQAAGHLALTPALPSGIPASQIRSLAPEPPRPRYRRVTGCRRIANTAECAAPHW
jgi:hypothetical protein